MNHDTKYLNISTDRRTMSASLDILLNIIIKTYMTNTYCLAIFIEEPFNITLDGIPILTFDNQNLKNSVLNAFDIGCSDFVVKINDPSAFLEEYDESVHITNQRRGNRRLVFLPLKENSVNREKLIKLLGHNALKFVPNALVVLPTCEALDDDDGCLEYEIGTHKYIGRSENDGLIILDTWNVNDTSFEKNVSLFPDKLSNMQGRLVRMATFSYKPYAILELDEKDNIMGLDGTEMKAAIEFCKWSNCTIEIVRDDEHEWGEIWDNRTGNGILGNIVTDRADMGYGALYSWYHEFLFLDLTMPIVRTGITCIAPVPQLVAQWLLPILPFNALMWSSVLVALIIGTIGFFITGRVAKKPYSIIQSAMGTLGILVLQVPPIAHPPIALRYVMLFLLLLSLLLSNIYSSGLASTITVPKYEDPIDTVQQLVDSNLNWGATHDAWIFSILLSTEPNIVHLLRKFKKWPEKKLRSKGRTRDFAYSVERLPAGHFAIGEYVTEESAPYLQLMIEDIYWEQCVFMARKSSPFTKRINTFFGRLHQSGLPHFWETQVVLKHSNFKVQLAVRLSLGRHGDGNADPRPLGVEHFQGPLFLWLLGILVAITIFVIELCIKSLQDGKSKRHLPKNEALFNRPRIMLEYE